MATVYKQIDASTARNKSIPSASADKKTKSLNILNTFVTLFKNKHLS
jgi:hypothetical protein